MIRAGFDPAEHQLVICPKCGEQIPLQPYEVFEWSVYSVSCPLRCGRFGIVSKFRMASGAECPLCGKKIMVLKRHPYTWQMAKLLRQQGLELYKFLPGGGICKLESEEDEPKISE